MTIFNKLGIDAVYVNSCKDLYPLTDTLLRLLTRKEYGGLSAIFKNTDFNEINLLCIKTLFTYCYNHKQYIPDYYSALQRATKSISRRNRDPFEILGHLIKKIGTSNENFAYIDTNRGFEYINPPNMGRTL